MLLQNMAELHVGYSDSVPVAMALTGRLSSEQVMIIDYLTVTAGKRNRGLGRFFVDYLVKKSMIEDYNKVIIEVESEETKENKARIQFWKNCGFLFTDYIHHYIWVPEPYHAMYYPISISSAEQNKVTGEELFTYINKFHRLCFRGGKE
ncbi:GNAT family N-acetyltransferase [Bacillus sp. B1-b2]|nr:GNAT family N-acetyltransferase [Bacillus sp. B1-b2]